MNRLQWSFSETYFILLKISWDQKKLFMKLLSTFRQHKLNNKDFRITIKVQVFGIQLYKINSRKKNNRLFFAYYLISSKRNATIVIKLLNGVNFHILNNLTSACELTHQFHSNFTILCISRVNSFDHMQQCSQN